MANEKQRKDTNLNTTSKILLILILLSLSLNGFMFYQLNSLTSSDPIYVTQRDTLYVDSVRILEHTKIQYKTIDKIQYVYIKDTVKDTIEIPIYIEHKIYKDTIKNDSSSYDISIRYSGFNSKIDEVNIKTWYINKYTVPVKKQRKFHLSVLAGVGALYGIIGRRFDVGPYIGIGGSYDLW